MITLTDLQALTELLRRTPMTMAETLYANDLMQRLARVVEPPRDGPPVQEEGD